LIRALGLAHYWQHLLDEGKFRSITEIAAAEDSDGTQALRLTLRAPAVVDTRLAKPDVAINLEAVLRRVMSLDWQAQGGGVRADVISRHSTNRPRGPPALWGCNRRRGRQELNHGAFSLNRDPRNNFLANFYWKDAPIHDKWGAIFFVIYGFTFKASARFQSSSETIYHFFIGSWTLENPWGHPDHASRVMAG
jgi:hypothetical protein